MRLSLSDRDEHQRCISFRTGVRGFFTQAVTPPKKRLVTAQKRPQGLRTPRLGIRRWGRRCRGHTIIPESSASTSHQRETTTDQELQLRANL